MSDQYRKLHGDAYTDWKQEKATHYAKNQREAFIAGFEAAASESKEFRKFRDWIETERDKAKQEKDNNELMFARYLAMVDVLTKLSEMGCKSD